jgi:glyoxylase-like metal-dependent hydrolase (beta-lactamase superfamily II)
MSGTRRAVAALLALLVVVLVARRAFPSGPPDCLPTAELAPLARVGELTPVQVRCLEDRALRETESLRLLVAQAFLTNKTRWAALLEQLAARTDDASLHYKLAVHYVSHGHDDHALRHTALARRERWLDATPEQIRLRESGLEKVERHASGLTP